MVPPAMCPLSVKWELLVLVLDVGIVAAAGDIGGLGDVSAAEPKSLSGVKQVLDGPPRDLCYGASY